MLLVEAYLILGSADLLIDLMHKCALLAVFTSKRITLDALQRTLESRSAFYLHRNTLSRRYSSIVLILSKLREFKMGWALRLDHVRWGVRGSHRLLRVRRDLHLDGMSNLVPQSLVLIGVDSVLEDEGTLLNLGVFMVVLEDHLGGTNRLMHAAFDPHFIF